MVALAGANFSTISAALNNASNISPVNIAEKCDFHPLVNKSHFDVVGGWIGGSDASLGHLRCARIVRETLQLSTQHVGTRKSILLEFVYGLFLNSCFLDQVADKAKAAAVTTLKTKGLDRVGSLKRIQEIVDLIVAIL